MSESHEAFMERVREMACPVSGCDPLVARPLSEVRRREIVARCMHSPQCLLSQIIDRLGPDAFQEFMDNHMRLVEEPHG